MNEPNRCLLDGQTALITGASSGIGAASAVALAEAGAKVGVNFRGGREGAHEIVQRIRDGGGDALAIEADVSKEESVGPMFSRLIDAFGRVDILVANAGLQRDARVTNMGRRKALQASDADRAKLMVHATLGTRAIWAAFKATWKVGRILPSRKSMLD